MKYSVVEYHPFTWENPKYLIHKYDECNKMNLWTMYIPEFPNPFDAYFYLLENYKEEEIV